MKHVGKICCKICKEFMDGSAKSKLDSDVSGPFKRIHKRYESTDAVVEKVNAITTINIAFLGSSIRLIHSQW